MTFSFVNDASLVQDKVDCNFTRAPLLYIFFPLRKSKLKLDDFSKFVYYRSLSQ